MVVSAHCLGREECERDLRCSFDRPKLIPRSPRPLVSTLPGRANPAQASRSLVTLRCLPVRLAFGDFSCLGLTRRSGKETHGEAG